MSEQQPASEAESASEWLAIAKRAAALVQEIDLDKVRDHNEPEVTRLASVVDQLDSLSAGNLDALADSEQVPDMDPEHLRRSQLMQLLDDAGYNGRIGRVYVDGSKDPFKPVDIVPHRDGLPPFDMVVAPDYSPAQGIHGVFVSAKAVVAALVPMPAERHRWRTLRSQPYESDEELIDLVTRFVSRPGRG